MCVCLDLLFFPHIQSTCLYIFIRLFVNTHSILRGALHTREWKSNMVSEKKHLVIRTKVYHSKTHYNGLHHLYTYAHTRSQPRCAYVYIHCYRLLFFSDYDDVDVDDTIERYNYTYTWHSAHRPHWSDRIEFQQLFWYPHSAIKIWWVHEHMTTWVYAYRFRLVFLSLLYPC